VCVFGVLAIHDVKERRLDFFSDGATAASTNFDAVEFTDGRDFGGGAGKESFVADVNFVAPPGRALRR
jgi:hypothetical protein